VDVKVPAGASAGTGTLVLTAVESGTVVKAAVLVAASVPVPPKCTPPVKPPRPADVVGQVNYGTAMAAYRKCLKG
jgi:5'-nucleotidase